MSEYARQVPLLLTLLAAVASGQAQEISLPNLQFLTRVTYGVTVRDLEALRALGREGYLDRELVFRGDDGLSAEVRSFIDALPVSRTRSEDLAAQLGEARRSAQGKSDDQKREVVKTLRKDFAQLDFQAFERRTVRALYSPHQLQEMLAWFWFNHFNVFEHDIDGINRSRAVAALARNPLAAGRSGSTPGLPQIARYPHFLTIARRARANAADRRHVSPSRDRAARSARRLRLQSAGPRGRAPRVDHQRKSARSSTPP